jgi:hypothetical protein
LKANPTTEAYRDLPVIFVDDCLSLELDIGVWKSGGMILLLALMSLGRGKLFLRSFPWVIG